MRTGLNYLICGLLTGLLPGFNPVLSAPPPAGVDPLKAPAELVGRWIGEAQVLVFWCNQKTIALDVTIDEGGRVSGSLGDAVITGGAVIPRTSRVLTTRWMYPTEYFIRAELSGPLVKAEGIFRDSATIQVSRLEDGRLVGGLHSNGRRFLPGASREELKKKTILSAARLRLSRVEEIKE
jgi:hypothetical protein